MEAHQINPRYLCFEITETAAVNAPDIMHTNMKALSLQKTSFALDDYGSGFTDLNYIMVLPFSLIKLDKGLIHAGFKTGEGRIALESTIALIKRLGRSIVAEGVETEEQASALTMLGCDYLQGFYFSKPLNESDFLKLLSV
jgi:EAL domain-containing protein (putative c-di-GMP-specific phosphodiesterase class I)